MMPEKIGVFDYGPREGGMVVVTSDSYSIAGQTNYTRDDVAAAHEAKLVELLKSADRCIRHYGANETETGRDHPQVLLLSAIDAALAEVGK